MNGVYLLPFKRNRLIEGWPFSGVLSATTGTPFNVIDGFEGVGIAAGNPRPNLNPAFTGDIIEGSPTQWFNPAVFSLQIVGTYGDFGRDALRNPGLFDTDFALM